MKHRNKKRSEKCYILIFKKGMRKSKKTLLQWRTIKVIEMKGIVILVKAHEMYNILKGVLAIV